METLITETQFKSGQVVTNGERMFKVHSSVDLQFFGLTDKKLFSTVVEEIGMKPAPVKSKK